MVWECFNPQIHYNTSLQVYIGQNTILNLQWMLNLKYRQTEKTSFGVFFTLYYNYNYVISRDGCGIEKCNAH